MSPSSETEHFVCIACPVGCPLQLTHEGTEIVEVEGNECNRGAKYARQEFKDPRRGLATTVVIRNATWARLPVKTSAPIPKDRVMEAARQIHGLIVHAPVRVGDVLLANILGEAGIDVIATRSMTRVDSGAK